jgi:hypothetical protein
MRLSDTRRNVSATQDYAFITGASADRVWSTLTCPTRTPVFLYGLSAVSIWQTDAPIELRLSNAPYAGELCGHVLYADRPSRLSCSVQAGAGDPAVYLTWHMRDIPTGCIVRLSIDEPELPDDSLDGEETWLRLVAALERLLAE